MADPPFVAMIATATWPGGVTLKIKIALVLALAALIASFGAKAGWKWHSGVGKTQAQYKIAGWSWGDGAVQGTRD
jgi:hypothetical protein